MGNVDIIGVFPNNASHDLFQDIVDSIIAVYPIVQTAKKVLDLGPGTLFRTI